MQIKVTEHKSIGALNPIEDVVRVFVDGDFHYGYFVPEHQLFGLLTAEQQQDYLRSDTANLDVPVEVAQKLIDLGQTPFTKRRVTP